MEHRSERTNLPKSLRTGRKGRMQTGRLFSCRPKGSIRLMDPRIAEFLRRARQLAIGRYRWCPKTVLRDIMYANKSAIARDGGVTAVVFRYAREEENHFPHQTISCRRNTPGQYGFWLQIGERYVE